MQAGLKNLCPHEHSGTSHALRKCAAHSRMTLTLFVLFVDHALSAVWELNVPTRTVKPEIINSLYKQNSLITKLCLNENAEFFLF